MKPFVLLLFLLTGFSLLSQEQDIKGKYLVNLIASKKDTITYHLDLNANGTFFFSSYTYHTNGIPQRVHRYGKGKWKTSRSLVYFSTDSVLDLDATHQLNFTNTIARFSTKHPRDISNKVVNTRLQFFESDISWMPRIEMLKQ